MFYAQNYNNPNTGRNIKKYSNLVFHIFYLILLNSFDFIYYCK